MNILLETILIVLLLLVFIQDMKYRAIHVLLPLGIIIIGFVFFLRETYAIVFLWHNFLFLILTCAGLYVYLLLKFKEFVNPFKSIGLGDFLFFIAVLPYFSTSNYILYFITGMFFSIFSFLIIKTIKKTNLVPLAGLLALYMCILRLVVYVTNFDFYKTKFI